MGYAADVAYLGEKYWVPEKESPRATLNSFSKKLWRNSLEFHFRYVVGGIFNGKL